MRMGDQDEAKKTYSTKAAETRPPVGDSDGAADRRRDVRIATNDPAVLTLVDSASSTPMPIQILDVSKGGLKMSAPSPLRQGTMVHIRFKETYLLAEVRYCTKVDATYHLGVLFREVFPVVT